ncbi:MAG: hypothetical protein IJV65_01755 [Kiritimatiellae bacterium]|nr:hypothetical protein [Kiritimatiellia bacterium]
MKNAIPAAFLALWTAALCTPQAARLLSERTGRPAFEPFPSRTENRRQNPWPDLFEKAPRKVPHSLYGRALENWYHDRYAWRTELIRFGRRVSFEWLQAPVGRDVPGLDGWRFMRITWRELEDYLGAIPLDDAAIAEWVALFEARHAWAEAVGTSVMTLLAAPKAQVRWQQLRPGVRDRRGRRIADQLRDALADSPARDDVLFVDEDLAAAFAAGREVFFYEDHHPCPHGIWVLYERLNRRLRELHPERVGESIPWFDDPPPEVRAGLAPGCWEENRRLVVSSPGERQDDGTIPHDAARYPYCNVQTVRDGGGLTVVMGHDSFMRFTLSSWLGGDGSVRFPFARGVGRVRAFLFHRLSPGFLEWETRSSVPEAFVEQFPEFRLAEARGGGFMDASFRAAAVFARAEEPAPGAAPPPGAKIAARAVFDGVATDAPGAKSCTAVLEAGGRELGRRPVSPGFRRAVFFDPAEPAAGAALSVRLEGGSAASTNLVWRLVRQGAAR